MSNILVIMTCFAHIGRENTIYIFICHFHVLHAYVHIFATIHIGYGNKGTCFADGGCFVMPTHGSCGKVWENTIDAYMHK